MKIVHVVFGLGLGGIETMLVNIVNEQVSVGHDITILCLNDMVNQNLRNSIDSRVKFCCVARPIGSKNPYYILKFNYKLYSLKADIIHVHSPSIAKIMFMAPLVKRMCVTRHDMHVPRESHYLRSYKHIYTISNTVREDLIEKANIDSVVVLNGINMEKISIKTANVKNDDYRIVQVSRLIHEKKGQHILLNAIKLVKERGYKVSVDFIGDGPSMQYLEELIQEYGLKEEVNLIGAKSQQYIFDNLCKYDLFVQPSIYEGFGLTVAEAMAAKTPVLVSENQGPLEIIDNGKYGYSFKNGDPKDCAEKIIEIINRGVSNDMIDAAYKRVEENYSVKQTANNYIREYQNIIISDK